ncbi:MAG: helix-turn-helix transcriptional regulator [Synergistaceae bacterium]
MEEKNTPIKQARLEAGLTQQALADWLKIPKRTIENWEGEKRTPPEWAELLIVEKIKRDAHLVTKSK